MLPKVRALDEGAGMVGVWMGSRSVAVGQSDQSRCSSDEGRAEFEARLRGEAKRIETSLFFFSRPAFFDYGYSGCLFGRIDVSKNSIRQCNQIRIYAAVDNMSGRL